MSCYFVKPMGWRYDFQLRGKRYTSKMYETEGKARRAEIRRKEKILNPEPPEKMTPTDMGFLALVNKRLDHLKAYGSERHYKDHIYHSRKWAKEWNGMRCSEVDRDKIQTYLLKRVRISPFTANKDLRYLRALFNFGKSREWILENPTRNIPFFPVEKKVKYVPSEGDVLRVIAGANPETQDYLWTIKETMGRMGEINRLKWDDVNLESRSVILYTRKKRGGHLTPRVIPMTRKLFEVLARCYEKRDPSKPWVFWQRYWDRKEKRWVEGPYQNRKKIMKTLCKKARVRYFRFHALRHLGASILDKKNVNLGSIQRILGHESRTTTEIYLHSIGEADRQAMQVYERASQESHISPA